VPSEAAYHHRLSSWKMRQCAQGGRSVRTCELIETLRTGQISGLMVGLGGIADRLKLERRMNKGEKKKQNEREKALQLPLWPAELGAFTRLKNVVQCRGGPMTVTDAETRRNV
jgi:hypothetical protein